MLGQALTAWRWLDQYCWVPGVDGLSVADASIFPDVTRANTTAMMIGEKPADGIKAGD